MPAVSFDEIDVIRFFASLVRVSTLFVLLPIFGDNSVPHVVKIFLAFTVNLVVFPVVTVANPAELAEFAKSDLGLMSLALKEALVGIVFGFVAKIFFDALNFSFGYMGILMGFNLATAYDHHHESNTPVISQLIMILATLLFLAADGHHFFLQALVKSYELVPLGAVDISRATATFILETAEQVFWIGIKLSAPMCLAIFLINCAFGIVGKAVPQINVLVVSFTVNILCGFLVLLLVLPVLGTSVDEVFQQMFSRVMSLMHLLA